jgi:hypothetical protein
MRTPPRRLRRRPAQKIEPFAPGNTLGMALFAKDRSGHLDGSVLLVVPRVGSIRHLQNGYELGACDSCGHAVWQNATIVAGFHEKGTKVRTECMSCGGIEGGPA